MNTPSHAIINLALGDAIFSRYRWAIVLGAILPDIPIFIFYGWAKSIANLSEKEIWTQAYWQPGIQNWVALFHSLPLAAIAAVVAWKSGQKTLLAFCLSLILHSFLDLPVHHDDAHRHFFPFSNYRFISPFSYWDPNHYGTIVAAIELLSVLAATIYLFGVLDSRIAKGVLIATNLLYAIAYFRFYLSSLLS